MRRADREEAQPAGGGVGARVNFATETAHVTLPERRPRTTASRRSRPPATRRRLPPPTGGTGRRRRPRDRPGARTTRPRRCAGGWLVSAVLTVPVLLLAMVPALQFRYWQWLSLTLAAPVVLWGAWPFHRAAALNVRHGAATMDTLICDRRARRLRLVAVRPVLRRRPACRACGCAPSSSPRAGRRRDLPRDRRGRHHVHPGRAVLRGAGQAAVRRRRCGRCSPSAPRTPRVLERDGHRRSGSRSSTSPSGDLFVVRPGEKVATDGVVVDGSSAVDACCCTGEPVPVEVGPGRPWSAAHVNAAGRARGPRHPGRRRHHARPDRPAGHPGADRQGRRYSDWPTGCRPCSSPSSSSLALAFAASGWSPGRGAAPALTGGRRRADHRLPVRAGPRDPDRPARRHRPRRAARASSSRAPRCSSTPAGSTPCVLDKTGTVTSGRMSLIDVVPPAASLSTSVLRLRRGRREHACQHPVRRPGRRRRRASGLGVLPAVTGFARPGGLGVEGVVEGDPGRRRAGQAPSSPRYLGARAPARGEVDEAATRGQTAVLVAWDGRARGALTVTDTVKPTPRARRRRLRSSAYAGPADRRRHAPARAVAARSASTDVYRRVLPGWQGGRGPGAAPGRGARRARNGRRRRQRRRRVGAADLGHRMGTGTDVASRPAT